LVNRSNRGRQLSDTALEHLPAIVDRLGVTRRGLVALAAALVAIAVTGVVLVAVSQDVISGNGLEVHDAANLRFFIDHRTPMLVSAAKSVTTIGGMPFLVAVAVVVGGLLWWRGARLAVAVAPAFALGVAGTAAAIGKQLVGRGRPPVALHLVTETEASFPSGHATDSAALYLTIGLLLAAVVFRRPLTRVLSVVVSGVLAAAVGGSRLLLGVHWPTDVLAGWSLGAVVALTVTTAVLMAARPVPVNPTARSGHLGRLWLNVQRILTLTRPPTDQATAQT
jgi:membrane-associated phospholipid phosphatase